MGAIEEFKNKIHIMNTIAIKIVNNSPFETPVYATAGSAGFDLRANLGEQTFVFIKPLERKLIPTGLFFEIPEGMEGQVRPRSGLALKQGITVLNSPGTLDSSYRGEVGVILINLSNEEVKINHGDRIAQMVISRHATAEFIVVGSVSELTTTERAAGGFGSTGVK